MHAKEKALALQCGQIVDQLCTHIDNLYSPPSGRKKEINNNNLTKLNYYNIHSTISLRSQQNEVLQNTLSHRR